jgi:hypothetical protein
MTRASAIHTLTESAVAGLVAGRFLRLPRSGFVQSLNIRRCPNTRPFLRTFEIDVLACPGCGGRLRFLATIEDPAVVKKILSHLGIAHECQSPSPVRPPPEEMRWLEFQSD